MTDLTPAFAGLLQQHGKQLKPRTFSADNLDDFLKEAYKINEHIVSLHRDLRSIRQSYLSTAQPRRTQLRAGQQHNDRFTSSAGSAKPMSDRDREKVDADAKQMLRKLNASIKGLRETEEVRHETEIALITQKYGGGRGFSLAKQWVAGGLASSSSSSKSNEQAAAEDREKAVSTHRGSVLWMLGQRLQNCIATQQEMMEIRISREMEKNRSVLAKARAPPEMTALRAMMEPGDGTSSSGGGGAAAEMGRRADEEAQKSAAAYNPVSDLTDEQIQMFQQENADMLRHYESTLDQVRTAQKSLIEISELQTQLVDNLTTQSANIDLLMADSSNTTENVGGGNKQLKQATQKPSTAKYTFYATCGLCAFLVVWDLII
ncbi:hypothetical protein Micbo1qcDRAFT_165916 [Microdochium bolleyi]|uniref:t-SNARE coiled-coil homology domain-containing protein n=1 Tax=Microdochium bolleyi TaxID=196109 RepID=A0A136IWJ1_9PEZI|nr:hypothetical protein Micbo1qcDRAFT_165916 [Microdochium bolleyi]